RGRTKSIGYIHCDSSASVAHAIHGGPSEDVSQVVVRLELTDDRVDFSAIGLVRGRTQADVLEHFFDLTLRECLRVGELDAQRLCTVAGAGKAEAVGIPTQNLVGTVAPVVVPMVIHRD